MMTIQKAKVARFWIACSALTLFWSITAGAQTPAQKNADTEYQEAAVLWTQNSGERIALAYQAFALARIQLDKDLRTNHKSAKRRAVIVDIDETVLDNSRYQATQVKNHQSFSQETFTAWANREEATAIPGAVEFLKYAASKGVRVFYITNRIGVEREATAANLKKLGFPDVTDQTLMVKTDSSSKESRRLSVDAKYRIVLLMGDNLNDFAEVFEQSKTVESRMAAVEQNRDKFGARFIVLPNPMYGDWENAIYDYDFKLTEEQKAAKRLSHLKTIEK
jgi:5'-nucleotidase (lipoprotein e(P4) family)